MCVRACVRAFVCLDNRKCSGLAHLVSVVVFVVARTSLLLFRRLTGVGVCWLYSQPRHAKGAAKRRQFLLPRGVEARRVRAIG